MEDDVKVRELCTRIDEGSRALYKEMRDRDLALRNEMYEGLQSIRKEIWEKEFRNAKIWALVITAALIGAMARGFHWF
jgi:hypothetical protein